MTLHQLPGLFPGATERVLGDPIVTSEGATVLPVFRVRGDSVTAAGVFLVRGERATWTPVVDADRIALIGVATGFVAAALTCLAMLRRPPWPNTSITITKSR